jgi:hypothetical protein
MQRFSREIPKKVLPTPGSKCPDDAHQHTPEGITMIRNCRPMGSRFLAAAVMAGLMATAARATVVTFNTLDVAVFSSTAPSVITATTGQVIPGGFDNSSAGNEYTLSSLQLDIDGDLDINAPDPSIFFDFQIRTATFVGGQIVFDGFTHVFPPAEQSGGYVVTKGANSYLNLPFAEGDVIGDGADEFIRNGFGPPGPPDNNTFNVAIDEGGPVTQFLAGVDNFVGFILDTGDYGWIRVQYDATSPGTLTFLDGAYEDSGAPIVAGGGGASEDSADFDGDGDVDGQDFLTWQRGVGTTGTGSPSTGDANDDFDVDGDDLAVWRSQFGGAGSLGTVSAVPEPAAFAMAAWLVAAAVYRRR